MKPSAPILRFLVPALFLLTTLPDSAQMFIQTGPGIQGLENGAIALGDFDNDGKLDILMEGDDSISYLTPIWRNLGNGSFSESLQIDGVNKGALLGGDFYNGGRLDALVTGLFGGSTAVSQLWQNLGSNNFNLITNSGLPGIYNSYIATGDFDNDGRLDIMLWGTGAVQISRNLGSGLFTNMNVGVAIGSPSSVSGVFAADFDNDGYLDVLVGKVLWHNLGNGVFTNIFSFPSSGTAIGDFDNRGYLDVLVGGTVWRNLGNGTFTNIGSGLSGTGFAVGDYDNDGYLDVLAQSGGAGAIQVWRNLGNGNFTNMYTVSNAPFVSMAWGDFNNDARLDFIITGRQGVNPSNNEPILVAQIWQNNSGAPSNSPPTAPTNLTSQILGQSGVKLMWGAATDDHTPSTGLNYNIRVGSSSGGADIVSPESDPVTGQRRVVQIGNAQERLFSLLTNLTSGTYYWSVQAIDTAFAGGAFATEATFTIPPFPITGFGFATNGQFQVAFNAAAGASYTLQSSSNLTTWISVTNLIATTNAPAQLTDPNPTLFPQRYYRLSSP